MEYTRLGSSGLKVSKIMLGGMAFGSSNEAEGLKSIKKAYDSGINTWDTADTYSNGASERIIGKALKEFKIPRSKVVILTEIFNPVMDDDSRPAAKNDGPLVNRMGLSRKHVFEAVDMCLERLGTDYIDVLQIHRLDRETTPAEIMRALHDVVRSGKVHYLGASFMYAWEFAQMQHTAILNHWTPFISMQPFYNLLYREEERETISFCAATGVGIIPWSPLARGLLAKPTSTETARKSVDVKAQAWFVDANMDIVTRVEEISKKKGVSMALVATAWVLKKGCCPIVGLSSEARVEEIVKALRVELTDEEMKYLEEKYRPRNIQGM